MSPCMFLPHKAFRLKEHYEKKHEKEENKTSNTPKIFKCTQCDRQSSNKTHIQNHILRIHDKIKNIECEVCGKSFCENQELQTHIENNHTNPQDRKKEFKCDKCPKQFYKKFNLNSHTKSVHENIKNYKCQICEMKFCYQYQLLQHKSKKHDGKKHGSELSQAEKNM